MAAKLNVTSKWPSVWHLAHATANVNSDAITVTRASADVKWTPRLRRLSAKNKLRTCMLNVLLRVQRATLSVSQIVPEKMANLSINVHVTSSVHLDAHVPAINAR